MKVRYLVSMSGADYVRNANEKDEKGDFVYYEVEDDEAARLVEAGFAELETKTKKGK